MSPWPVPIPAQWRPAILILCIDVDMVRVQQQLDDGLVPILGGKAKRRPAVPVLRIDVDLACAQQQLDDGLVPFRAA